jgi:hypothetical protein
MARGALIAQGTPVQVQADPQVQAVYFGSGKTFGAQPSNSPHANASATGAAP